MVAELLRKPPELTMSVSLVVGLVVAAVVVFAAVRLAGAWLRYRGARVITCPENLQPAGVRVDASHAAASALASAPDLRLSTCSRWPEKAGCGQECLRQIEASPEDCLVRNILVRWYEGKSCALCGKPIGEIQLTDQKPALLLAGNTIVEWKDVAPEKLHAALAEAKPACFSCQLATSFARQHPELITDRGRPA